MGNQNEDERRSVRGSVSGRVQGVGFRWFALQSARRLGLGGTVKNLRDGRVEFRATGNAASVEQFVDELRSGPVAGRVDRIEIDELENATADSGDEFTIL